MANDSHSPNIDAPVIALSMTLRELGDSSKNRSRFTLMATGLIVGTVHGLLLYLMGTAVSWGMQSVGLAALVGTGVGLWHAIRQRVVIPLALVCWAMGAMFGTALFLNLDGTMVHPLSGVIAWMMGATVARTVTRTITRDEDLESVRSACLAGLVGGAVGWPVGATVAGTIVQLLEDPWSWTAVGAASGAVIGLLETVHLNTWLKLRQALLKAIGGGILVTCAYFGDGPLGWVAGASLIWMFSIGFFMPAERHTAPVLGVAVSPNGDLAVSCSADKTARFWQLMDGQQMGYLQRRGEHSILSVVFSHDGQFAVAGRDDGKLIVFDGTTGHEHWSASSDRGAIRCVAVSANDARVVAGGDNGFLCLFDFESGEELRRFTGHDTAVTCVAFAPNGPYILSGDAAGVVRLWNLDNAEEIAQFNKFTGAVHAVAFSEDGKHMYVADDRAIQIWDVHGRKKVRTMRGHKGPVLSLAIFGGDADLISGGQDGTTRLWRSETGKQLGALLGHDGAVNSIAVADDRTAIVTGGEDGTVRAALMFEFEDDEEEYDDDEDYDDEDEDVLGSDAEKP